MKPAVLIVLILIVVLIVAACAAPAAAPLPSPSPTSIPTSTPSPTPLPTATAAPSSIGALATSPRALVDRYIDAWAHGTIADIMALFPDKLEFKMGPAYTTEKLQLGWFMEYWNYGDSETLLTRCDPELGNTVRCDLVYTNGCTPYLGALGVMHFNTVFTAHQGKLEKVIATMPEDEWAELMKTHEGTYRWAADNLGDEWAQVQSGRIVSASEVARIELAACIGYTTEAKTAATASPTP